MPPHSASPKQASARRPSKVARRKGCPVKRACKQSRCDTLQVGSAARHLPRDTADRRTFLRSSLGFAILFVDCHRSMMFRVYRPNVFLIQQTKTNTTSYQSHIKKNVRWIASVEDFRLPVVLFAAPGGAGQPHEHISKIDVAFPVLHGPMGEDGTIQGLLELAAAAYAAASFLGITTDLLHNQDSRVAAQVLRYFRASRFSSLAREDDISIAETTHSSATGHRSRANPSAPRRRCPSYNPCLQRRVA
jgi:hypothetical protein